MTDILFTHSYFLHFDPKEFRSMMPYPPLGTITAASLLRDQGFTVALHDVMLDRDEDDILPSLQEHQPKLLVIYDDSFNFLTKMCLSRMRQAAFRLAKHAKSLGSTVIVFNSDSADHVEQYLKHDVDYVILGEAEITLLEISRFLLRDSKGSLDDVNGLAFVRDKKVVVTQKRDLLRHLDTLPFPAWDLVDVERYRAVWKKNHGYFSVNLSTTRGCPFHCNWCAKPLYGQVYNSRSPEHVADEMAFLKRHVGPDHLWITDDIFGLKPGWIRRFAEVINEREAVIPFKCLSRADLLLRENTVQDLKRAGCQSVWIGAESGSQEVLDSMDKGIRVEEIYRSTALLHSIGIRVGFFLQFGYPGESYEDILLTLKMVRECRPDEIGISVSYPLPGTLFYDRVRAQLGEKKNWVVSEDLDVMFEGTFPADFYRVLHRITHKKFRIWQGLNMLSTLTKDRSTFGAGLIRPLAAGVYHALTLPPLQLRLRRLAIPQAMSKKP